MILLFRSLGQCRWYSVPGMIITLSISPIMPPAFTPLGNSTECLGQFHLSCFLHYVIQTHVFLDSRTMPMAFGLLDNKLHSVCRTTRLSLCDNVSDSVSQIMRQSLWDNVTDSVSQTMRQSLGQCTDSDSQSLGQCHRFSLSYNAIESLGHCHWFGLSDNATESLGQCHRFSLSDNAIESLGHCHWFGLSDNATESLGQCHRFSLSGSCGPGVSSRCENWFSACQWRTVIRAPLWFSKSAVCAMEIVIKSAVCAMEIIRATGLHNYPVCPHTMVSVCSTSVSVSTTMNTCSSAAEPGFIVYTTIGNMAEKLALTRN